MGLINNPAVILAKRGESPWATSSTRTARKNAYLRVVPGNTRGVGR